MLNLRNRWLGLLTASLLGSSDPTLAQQGGDLQAQILYASQTEDTNRLITLVQNLKVQINPETPDLNLRYHLAHAEYRLSRLERATRAKEAEAALDDCVSQLKAILRQDSNSAEAMILQAACYLDLADSRNLQSTIMRGRAMDRLATANNLLPHNPRLVFVQSLADLAGAKPGSPGAQHAFEELKSAAQLFDQSSATSVDTPGWGHAEAYMMVGRELRMRGDVLGARNWIEKSLIVAPDYKEAQRQLELIQRS